MTEYARPADREQIVRLNSGARATAPARPSPDRPRTCIPEVGSEACIEFAESRRTGNITVTLRSPTSRPTVAEAKTPEPSPVLQAAPIALDAGKKPHAGMPTAMGDFYEDLQTFGAEAPLTPHGAMIEDLMAQAGVDPASDATRSDPGMPVFRGRADVRLARIIDAWPRLASRTRAAMTAVLDQAKDPAVAGRRRSRRTANPAS